MKNYINNKNQVFGFELDGSQDHLITTDMTAISDADLDILRAPTAGHQLIIDTNAWKASRQAAVEAIEVTHNLIVYQGDEVSQDRMTRAITAMPNNTATIKWTAKDNKARDLTKVDLKAILLNAGQQQSALWSAGRP